MRFTLSRMALSGALALGALGVLGGLTPGAPTADAAPSVSPFAGTYEWVSYDAPNYWYWPAPVTISDKGEISSSYFSGWEVEWTKGSVNGQVSTDGRYSFTVSTSSYSAFLRPKHPERTRGHFKSVGSMTADAAGNLVGTEDDGTSFVWLHR